VSGLDASGPPVRRERDPDEGEAGELAIDDDIGLPELDGEAEEGAPVEEPAVEGDENVGLDDATAEEAAEAVVDPPAGARGGGRGEEQAGDHAQGRGPARGKGAPRGRAPVGAQRGRGRRSAPR